jgi:hypothetical protein
LSPVINRHFRGFVEKPTTKIPHPEKSAILRRRQTNQRHHSHVKIRLHSGNLPTPKLNEGATEDKISIKAFILRHNSTES